MILLDVHVMVEAAHRDAARHEESASWLAEALAGPRPVALADAALVGCLRVLTHRKVFADPAPPRAALDFVNALRVTPGAVLLAPTRATWEVLDGLVDADEGLRGNLVPDAWLAALAVSHGAALATRDRGFARFPGLTVLRPG
jgi:toxin-antitoxin system PIN domain toxin